MTEYPVGGAYPAAPNLVLGKFSGYYISFNRVDYAIYGDVTTALVDNVMRVFLILNGDHRKEWDAACREGGYQGGVAYFEANRDKANPRSDSPIAGYNPEAKG